MAGADRRHRLAGASCAARRTGESAAAALVGVAIAIVAASVGIHYVAGEALADSVGVRPMIAGLAPIIGSASSIDITRVTIVSLVLLVILVAAALVSRRGVTLALVGARVPRDRRRAYP